MSRRLFIPCLLLATAVSVAGVAAADSRNPYNPAQIYPGAYGANAVYYRQTFRAKWRLGVTSGVTCPDAARTLKVSGFWKGHLNTDGSCGVPDEPSEWALGNRLNYEAIIRGGR
jgi:hypothetical protein